MTTSASPHYTAEEYLAFERGTEDKHEYVDGRIVPAIRVSLSHIEITGSITVALWTRLRGGPCRVYASRMRVQTLPGRGFAYPDVLAVCGKAEVLDEEGDTLLNPALIVEVLSAETEAYDRGGKFQQYRMIESLREYVLVSQHRMLVERFIRDGEMWIFSAFSDPDEEMEFTSVGCTIPLREIYENVEFPAPAAADAAHPSSRETGEGR